MLPSGPRQNDEQSQNTLKVLKAIRTHGPVARTDLPGLTGLSGGLITKLTASLLARDLVIEEKEQNRTRGRPRSHLSINGQCGLAIGACLTSHGTLSVNIVDLEGQEIHSQEAPITRQDSVEDLALEICRTMRCIIEASGRNITDIRSAGVALPAVTAPRDGLVYFMATFPPGTVNVGQLASRALGLPVIIENDITCMARAEHWFGRASGSDSFTLVHFGIGLGAAHYSNGVPLYGANGIAAELGHLKIDLSENARECFCGAKGCATMYASMAAAIPGIHQGKAVDLAQAFNVDANFHTICGKVHAGHDEDRDCLLGLGRTLAVVVANVVNLTNPGRVIVLVPNPEFATIVSDVFHAELRKNVMPGLMDNNCVELAVTSSDWQTQAAAALALEQAYLDWNSA